VRAISQHWSAEEVDGNLRFAPSTRDGPGRAIELREALKMGLLRDVAQERGHTQAQLAQRFGCSLAAVTHYWQGRKIPRAHVYRRALFEYLLHGRPVTEVDATERTAAPAKQITQVPGS